jgi:uncharacterized membrane protein YedE/YeeE
MIMKIEHISALLIGALFGFGLLVSGMANPDKVLSFLDLAGAWDPSLALVMAGAIAVGLIAFGVAGKRQATFTGDTIRLPANKAIDRRLLMGSLGFGVGWGLAGFCPGPALVAVGAGEIKAVVFVLAMLAGMSIYELFQRPAKTE